MTNGPVPPAPTNKGVSPWVWVGIGCAGLLVLGAVAAGIGGYFLVGKAKEVARDIEDDPIAATARMIAMTNPEIELVAADKENGTVTFRNTETGEEFTFDYEDIEEGRFSFTSGDETASIDLDTEGDRMTITTDEGTATFGADADLSNRPDWIPIYPGADAKGTFNSETSEMRTGGFTFVTDDSPEGVLSFYGSELESAGLTIASRTTTPEGGLLIANASDSSRTATVTASTKDGEVEVMVNFSEKR